MPTATKNWTSRRAGAGRRGARAAGAGGDAPLDGRPVPPQPLRRVLVPAGGVGPARHAAPHRARRPHLLPRHRRAVRRDLRDARPLRRALRLQVRALPQHHASRSRPSCTATSCGRASPNQCCSIRKVEPLQRALGSVDAWVTGIRRDQAPTRANSKKVEWDDKFGLVKANPLADWTLEGRVGVHPRARRPLQPAARPELPVDRLHALHPPGDARRGPPRRPLGRAGKGRVRAAPGREPSSRAPRGSAG